MLADDFITLEQLDRAMKNYSPLEEEVLKISCSKAKQSKAIQPLF